DPIGRQLRSAGVERRVVGVVPTGKYQSLREAPLAFQYLPLPQTRSFGAYLHVRSAGDPVLLTQSIREIVRELDPNLPLFDVKTMTSHLGIALMPARLAGILLGSFGLLGLILASVGIYGVMAYAVAQRTREIGIRVALGANRSEVTGLVLRQGSRLVLVGGAVGILGALGLRQAVRSLLFTGQGLDLLTFVGVPLLLGGIALLATYLPARKAASVDPVTALKHE
ncbi:MAG: FtsX-like permease family protein, partial [Gemmatimonadota bacterium]